MRPTAVPHLTDRARLLAPGLTLAVTVAMAAQFLSGHYGVPVMLMAILLGMPLPFLAEDDRAETEVGVVRLIDGFIDRCDPCDASHWAERFDARDIHILGDAR